MKPSRTAKSSQPTKLRIWIRRSNLKGETKKYVLVSPPFPRVNDILTIQGVDWTVFKTQDASDAIEIKFPARVKQVYP